MPTIQTFAGFEWGTVHDVAGGVAGTTLFDGVTGTYGTNIDVVTGSGSAVGSYVGQVATLNNKNFFWNTNELGASKTDLVVSLRFRFTSFPTSDNDIHAIDVAASTDRAGFFYQVSTGKIVAWITSATQVASNAALTLNTWYTLQFKYTCSANPNTLDWVLNGVSQTQVSNTLSTSTVIRYALGNRGGTDGTIQFDDVAVSTTGADHPLPLYNVRLVKADTGGTTTEVGTANSTARFTTNNTIDATHNSANILTAISEVPPTIGASASGVAQRAGGASDALSIPMTSISLGGDTIVACRVLVCGWANGTLGNNIGVRAWNGSAETILVAGTVASTFQNSTTDPSWFAAMYAGVTNQTTLDALEVRLGYSTDIAPEPGAHAVYAEILTLPGTGATVTASGVVSNEQFGTPSVTPGSITLSQSGIVSGERFGLPAVTSTASVVTSGIASSERFGSPAISATATISVSGIVTAEQSGLASVTSLATISAAGIITGERTGLPSISSQATISTSGIPSSEQPGSASTSSLATISPSGITGSELFGSPAVLSTVPINTNGISSSELFGAASLTPGVTAISAAGVRTGEQFGNPSITPGSVNTNTSGVTTGEQFGSPAVFTSVAIIPGGMASGERFGTPSVTPGVATSTPGFIGSSESFGAVGVSAGTASMAPGGTSTLESFGSPSVSGSSAGPTPSGIISAERFGSSSVTPGVVNLQTVGISTAERFGSPSIAIAGNLMVVSAGVGSGERFGNPYVSGALATRYGPVIECSIDRRVIQSPIDREVILVEIQGE